MKRFLDPHRRRMPWTASKECVPDVVPYKRKIWCWVAYKEWIWIALTVHRRWICWRHSGRPWPHVSTIRPPERTFFMWPLGWNQMDSGNGFTARSGRRGRTTSMSSFPPLILIAMKIREPRTVT
ncbi:hypothetical protein C3747_340g29 [Trypanosoma cruzi]|uniref:Uncharacterized protein n=1 Tax=Trypanosoma cruzi TaxID=5693 RepID=A0A2V2V4T8_TRYCR|nr:hypothetical protein C3747_340g29 [Trypanosoma cruzi]